MHWRSVSLAALFVLSISCGTEAPLARFVLWAGDRPEDLCFLLPGEADVAYLASTIAIDPKGFHERRRASPLKPGDDTRLIARVRLEGRGARWVDDLAAIAELAELIARHRLQPRVSGLRSGSAGSSRTSRISSIRSRPTGGASTRSSKNIFYPRRSAMARAQVASSAPASATAEEAAANEPEWIALQAAGNAPDLLVREFLAWSESHPGDPRTAEALHDAVRATRFGCRDAETHALSRKAVRALHKQVPKSKWTERTPYAY